MISGKSPSGMCDKSICSEASEILAVSVNGTARYTTVSGGPAGALYADRFVSRTVGRLTFLTAHVSPFVPAFCFRFSLEVLPLSYSEHTPHN